MPPKSTLPLSQDLPFWKRLVVLNGGLPLLLLIVDAFRGKLGANGVNYAIHTTGILSLLFLILSLAISPVRWLTGWNSLIGFRRSLGLYSFFYGCIHVAIYVGLDRALSLSSTIHELLTRRYLQVGLAALLLMTPLALTSTNAMISRLGAKRWKLLHRLAYASAALGALHYILLVKSDLRQPLAFAGVLAVLLTIRLIARYFVPRKPPRRSAPSTAEASSSPAPKRKVWRGELQVAAIFDETPNVRTFRLVAPDGGRLPFEFLPGQYLSLQLNIDGRRVNRSYTIASSAFQSGFCELSIKREDRGLVSSHLHRHLRIGDRLAVTSPAGRFVFTGTEADSVVLIGGGVGITPLMSITRSLTDRGWAGDINLLLVAKTPHDLIFHDELAHLQSRFRNLHIHITLTRPEPHDSWSGARGRITADWLQQCVPEIVDKPVFLCGPDDMMAATQQLLLDCGVPASQIHQETFVSPGVSAPASEVAALGALAEYNGAPLVSRAASLSLPADDRPATTATATFARSHRTSEVSSEITLLEASEDIGVNLPYECRSGVCGQCKVRLLSGPVVMDVDAALTPQEKHAGWILACQSRCRNDVTIDA